MNHCTKEQLIAFEWAVKTLWDNGDLPYLIHLCGGNEEQLIEIFKEVQPGDWVFSTHRNHYHALLSGMAPDALLEKIKRGDSMFVFGKQSVCYRGCENKNYWFDEAGNLEMPVNFLSSSVLAGTCAIAAGVAWAMKEEGRMKNAEVKNHVWCFLGDGAEDEGHFYEAVRFVNGRQLPCTFIIEDNNRSVDTDKAARHPIPPGELGGCVKRYHYTPTYPHAGSGCKHKIEFRIQNSEAGSEKGK
jgi:pyruvate dehydrogenase E1 component alpha subunit